MLRLGLLCGALLLLATMVGSTTRASYYSTLPSSRAKDFSIVQKDGVWHIVVINAPVDAPPAGQPYSPGLQQATSYDLEHWTNGGTAIPVGPDGSWDSFDTWAPSIIESGGTYYLYYTGVQLIGNAWVQKIGLATSTDLSTWTKYDSNPIFDCSQNSWQYWNLSDPYGAGTDCRDPYVVRDEPNNRWVMFYNGRLNNPDHSYEVPTPAYWLATPAVVGMATSTDLIHWTDAGFVSSTASYQAESPHIIQHDGTYNLVFTSNCTFSGTTKCIVYTSGPSLTGPFTGFADLPAVEGWHFASEDFFDEQGREYFGRSDGALRFSYVDWSSGQFNLIPMVSATLVGAVYLDSNHNGTLDNGEDGIDYVYMQTYLDNGDGVFSATDDHLLSSTSRTLNQGRDGVRQHGTYRLGYMPAGHIWVTVNPSNLDEGQPLAGMESTTGETVAGYSVDSSTTYSTKYFGFAPPDTTPPAGVTDLHAQ